MCSPMAQEIVEDCRDFLVFKCSSADFAGCAVVFSQVGVLDLFGRCHRERGWEEYEYLK